MHVTAIIAAAGSGQRLGGAVRKQFLDIGGQSILERSVAAFARHPAVSELIVVLPPDLAAQPPAYLAGAGKPISVVAGGARRQDSVASAFDRVPPSADVVLVHDAARPFVGQDVITRAIAGASRHGAAIAATAATDTIKRVERGGAIVETIARETIYLAQTPQAFRRTVLADAVALGRGGLDATDEAMLAERAGHPVHVVEGDPSNVKITTAHDLEAARRRGDGEETRRAPAARAGLGYDLHRLVAGRPLILGGVAVPAERGALGHSDADVVCHAATDAILGAATLGDIGRHFPDSDPAWKGASSIDLLQRAAVMVRAAGYEVSNLDVVIILERPKVAPYIARIRDGVAAALGIDAECVSVKGKTNEGVDAVGRGEAIAAHAVALLTRV